MEKRNIPGFTGEVSLSKKPQYYRHAMRHAAEVGRVLPQALIVRGGNLIFCYDEGGFSGCWVVAKVGPRTIM